MKRAIIAAFLIISGCGVLPGANVPLEVEKRSVPRPAGQAVEPPMPRPLFLAQVYQSNKLWDPAAKTVYFVFDPSRPFDGFRKVYEGPGEQYCRFLTPLFGGVGAAIGQVDPKRKESERRLFWFDLLDGKPGATIATAPWDEWIASRELRFRTQDRLNRLNPIGGSLRSYPVDVSLDLLIDESSLLGASRIDGRFHAVLIDIVKEVVNDLGELPGPLQSPDSSDRILPAGPAARDGLVWVSGSFDDFALWYKPPGSRWLRVLRDIHIFKNFGGMSASLPVKYLGDRRFAVARTVQDEAQAESRVKDDDAMPRSLGVTMLVEGMTGRIVEETKPMAYNGNPDLDIPESWWSNEAREARRKSAAAPEATRAFHRDQLSNTWSASRGNIVQMAEGEEASLSNDSRWLAVHRTTAETGPPAKLSFRIIDGSTGDAAKFEISLPTREGHVNHAAWLMLASPSPGLDEIEMLQPARRDPFRDPW